MVQCKDLMNGLNEGSCVDEVLGADQPDLSSVLDRLITVEKKLEVLESAVKRMAQRMDDAEGLERRFFLLDSKFGSMEKGYKGYNKRVDVSWRASMVSVIIVTILLAFVVWVNW